MSLREEALKWAKENAKNNRQAVQEREAARISNSPIAVTLLIDNFYEGGDKIKTTVETQVPAPPTDRDSDEYADWEYEHIFAHTGTGQTEGDSAYFVTVASSSRPDLIPVGTEYEFGT